jgi:two-component system response regulator YesN
MYRLLIVDDEVYAVQAVESGIDWAAKGFTEVLCAYDADEAMEILQEKAVDIMICDIEMPGSSGVELLEWVNEHSPATVTIFLTAHADFNYAQQVVHLGGFEYLLKPIRFEKLEDVVVRALAELNERIEVKKLEAMYKTYNELQAAQKPLLKELFWQDLLSKRLQLDDPVQLHKSMDTYQMALGEDQYVMPILISIEHWNREFNERDEEILIYALRNAAAEMLIPEGVKGDVIADRNGILFAVLYVPEAEGYSRQDLKAACEAYIQAGLNYFYCRLSCYIGEAVQLRDVALICHQLIEQEQTNVLHTGQVMFLNDHEHASERIPTKVPSFALNSSEWLHLLEAGKTEAVIRQVEELFEGDAAEGMNSESLDALYHMLLGFVYQSVQQKGGSVRQMLGTSKWVEASAANRSVPQFLAWARKLLQSTTEYLDTNRTENSALVEKVKAYIDSHLQTVSREEAAAAVYLNAAYLSRLFKRETGISLMEYIISMKIKQAKLMLTKSNIKISDICTELGYENMPYFAKMFKKQIGLTPQEFRKRHQSIE